MASEDQIKTAFSTPDQGNILFTKMPFGLVNSAATFTRMRRKLLKRLDNVDSYIDDPLIHTPTWEGHLEALRSLLQRLREARLTARLRNCMFGYHQVDFVGHKVGRSQVCMSHDNVAKIKQLEKPTTKRQIRSVLSLADYYRDLVPHFSHLAAPLTVLTKKGTPNTLPWDDTHQTVFDMIINALNNEPVLHMFDDSKDIFIQTDASEFGIGGFFYRNRET